MRAAAIIRNYLPQTIAFIDFFYAKALPAVTAYSNDRNCKTICQCVCNAYPNT